ncbi:hypothetical protein QBC32DRAFT_368602 [Pseudoneurospora amorphoporcata]|uniref:Ankyrin repeat protein n=1 Tax=Pseudoneurospora amorphoporcata TaxID=241081 RepID=A0AAN6SIC8_9PEZI|nr:hypothetical protein QBC32DRAFT_368602 [Pseudoneurospora amorphoporcata]
MGPQRKQEASQKLKRLKEFFRSGGRRQQPQTPRRSEDDKNPPSPARTLSFTSFLEKVEEERKQRLQAGTDIYQAIKQNNSIKAIELYQNHAALNPKDNRGRTPLHAAAELGRDEILLFLLDQKGLNLDATDIQGYTALHLATLNHHPNCVFYLLERGANAQLVDGNGHLPSFYASGEIKRNFDNPPIVHSGDAAVNQWKDRFAWNTGPIPPEGPRKEVCHYFQGSLWVPDISTRWQVLPVWDLVYDQERNGDITRFNILKQRTEAKRKWIHLPIASRDLVLDLTKRIYAASGRDLRAYQKMEKLVSDMFRQVDVTGPEGKVHFKFKSLKHDHQADPGDKECISDSIYAMVLPVVDVDKKDYVSMARVAQEQATKNSRPLHEIKLHLDKRAKDHFSHMLKAVSFMDQPLPRGLDQSYHADLDNEKLDFLNNDQVMVRYIRYMKARCSRVLREMGYPTGHGSSDTEQMTSSHTHYEETESAPQIDQHQEPTNTEAGSPDNVRAPVQDDTASHIPRVQGPQPVGQTSFEAQRPPNSPRRTYTGASTTSQAQRRFSIQRSDTETSMSPDEAMKAFEALLNESSNQQKLAQVGNTVRLPGAGAALTPLKSSGQTENRAGPATPMPVTPGTPGTLVRELAGVGDKGSASISDAGPVIMPEPISLHESDDFLTVPYFWLFKIDADTIVTLYPERWDKGNEQQLYLHILESISDDRHIHKSTENGGMDLDIDLVSKAILKACMSFEAKALVPCINPDAIFNDPECGPLRRVVLPYTEAFSASIAQLYFQVTQRFDKLKRGMGSISKDPNKFYQDTQKETAILIDIDDTIGEIGMIKRVLSNQVKVLDRFQSEIGGKNSNKIAKPHEGETLARFDMLESEAGRVRSMVTTLLNLRQREATLEDALSMGEQSTMLFVFTAVTVLFAPLSFVVGLLALSINGLPELWNRSPLAEVFGLSILATGGLCAALWFIFNRYYRRAHGLDNGLEFNLDPSPSDEDVYQMKSTSWWRNTWSTGFERGGHGKSTVQGTTAGTRQRPRAQAPRRDATSRGENQGQENAGADSNLHLVGNLGGRRRRGMSGGMSVGPSLSSLSMATLSGGWSWNGRQKPQGALGDVEFGVLHA